MKVIALVCARNEVDYLEKTLASLRSQSFPVSEIVIVDDGSKDKTYDIAMKFSSLVINRRPHKESYVGKPEMAAVWNSGLDYISYFESDYILLLGADHVLPFDYIEMITRRMEEDKDIVIASGRIEGERYNKDMPRGSGRIVRTRFWKKIIFSNYPIEYGWESYPIFKAMKMGLRCVCYKDIVSSARSTTTDKTKSKCLGLGMYALGYYWLYALGRCALTFSRSPLSGIAMLNGWLFHKDVGRLDVADYVRKHQENMLFEKVKI